MIFTYSYVKGSRWTSCPVGVSGSISIGRDEINTLVLDDMMVSRRHAVIWQNGQQWWIEDMQSQNGVRLNGREVHGRERLRNHDVLFIGNTLMIFWFQTIIYNCFGEPEGRLSVNIKKKDVNFGRKILIRDIHLSLIHI